MNHWKSIAVFVVLSAALSFAQSSDPPAQTSSPASTQAASTPAPDNALRGPLPVVLSKSLDSKKLKEGDPVIAQTAVGIQGQGVAIPKGSKVVGHVTQAQARSKGDQQSSLGIAFDKIEIAKGKDMPMKGVLQALAPDVEASSGPDTGAAGPGTMPGHTDASTMPSPGQGPSGGTEFGRRRRSCKSDSASQGVIGIRDLQMDDNSVLTSSGKEVKLDSGTQMIVRAEILPQVSKAE